MLLTQQRSCDYVTVSNVYDLTVLYEHKKHKQSDADLKTVKQRVCTSERDMTSH